MPIHVPSGLICLLAVAISPGMSELSGGRELRFISGEHFGAKWGGIVGGSRKLQRWTRDLQESV